MGSDSVRTFGRTQITEHACDRPIVSKIPSQPLMIYGGKLRPNPPIRPIVGACESALAVCQRAILSASHPVSNCPLAPFPPSLPLPAFPPFRRRRRPRLLPSARPAALFRLLPQRPPAALSPDLSLSACPPPSLPTSFSPCPPNSLYPSASPLADAGHRPLSRPPSRPALPTLSTLRPPHSLTPPAALSPDLLLSLPFRTPSLPALPTSFSAPVRPPSLSSPSPVNICTSALPDAHPNPLLAPAPTPSIPLSLLSVAGQTPYQSDVPLSLQSMFDNTTLIVSVAVVVMGAVLCRWCIC